MRALSLSSRHRLILVSLIAISVLTVNALKWGYVSGDPLAYRARMEGIMSGAAPYLDAQFEHLPMMLIPMSAAWWLGGFSSAFAYRGVWVLLTTGAMLGLLCAISALAREVDAPRATQRWLSIVWPMIPIVVFRNDPWVVVATVIATRFALRGDRRSAGLWTAIAILAKGWPILMVLGFWRRGVRMALGVATLSSLAILVAISVTPGFSTGRAFTGMHSESLGGALWLAMHRGPNPPTLLETAGAIYVEAPLAMAVPGFAVGALLAVGAMRRMLRTNPGALDRLRLVAVMVIGLLVASPLQSAQFLFWASPFVAFADSKLARWIFTAASVLALSSVIGFDSLASNDLWWSVIVTLRNFGLITCGFLMLADASVHYRRHAEF